MAVIGGHVIKLAFSSICQMPTKNMASNLLENTSTRKVSHTYHSIVRFFFKLAFGGGALDMSRDNHCATCHELLFLKSYLAFFSNTTCFYFYLEIILNRFGNVAGTPQVPT